MSTQPKEQAGDTIPFYSRPKAERDAILRAAGIRPALSDDVPRFDFEPIRIGWTLRSIWYRIFPDGLWFERPRFLRSFHASSRLQAGEHRTPAETGVVPFYSRPKAERDEILRAAGIRPAESDEPPAPFEPIRLRPSLRRFMIRRFSRR